MTYRYIMAGPSFICACGVVGCVYVCWAGRGATWFAAPSWEPDWKKRRGCDCGFIVFVSCCHLSFSGFRQLFNLSAFYLLSGVQAQDGRRWRIANDQVCEGPYRLPVLSAPSLKHNGLCQWVYNAWSCHCWMPKSCPFLAAKCHLLKCCTVIATNEHSSLKISQPPDLDLDHANLYVLQHPGLPIQTLTLSREHW